MALHIEIEDERMAIFVNEQRKRKSLAVFIITYFKYAYYCGFSPFRLKDKLGSPVVVTWWLPKIVFFVTLVPCILFRIAESRDILRDIGSAWNWNPAVYFRVFHAITKFVFHIVLWYYLGFQSDRYLNVVKFIYESTNLPVPQFKHFAWKIVAPCTSIIFLTLGVFLGTTFVGRFLDCKMDGEMESNVKRMFQFCVNWGKYVLFMSHERVRCEDIPPGTINSSVDFTIGVVTGVATLIRQVSGFYEELYLPVGVFVFWHCSREFARRLERLSLLCVARNKNSKIWESALACYSSLRDFSALIRDAYGSILLQRMLLMIFDIPISFEYRSDLADKVRFILLFLISAVLYILAADASKQIKAFETWISKLVDMNLPGISNQQLSMLLHELQTNTVGISTNVGFTITYSFAANVSGVIITYFIICVQYSTSLSNNNKID